MNIFYINHDPVIAANAMTNKHIVKMILESAQMLCTAHRELDGNNAHPRLYKSAYKNHPSTVWVRTSVYNYNWLYQHFLALNYNYTERYGRTHASYTKLNDLLCNPPRNIPIGKFTQPPCAMPDCYKLSTDHTENYRMYYTTEKIKTPVDLTRYMSIIQPT